MKTNKTILLKNKDLTFCPHFLLLFLICSHFLLLFTMINTLKFGKFRQFLETRCDKLGVGLSLINPYNTSKIAASKYCNNMKLNIHSGASYVIARRFYNLD